MGNRTAKDIAQGLGEIPGLAKVEKEYQCHYNCCHIKDALHQLFSFLLS